MRIGYLVEGSTDRAVVKGLAGQVCPEAELIDGHFRGSLKGAGRKRELPKACTELAAKGADVIVNLNDANEMTWSARRDQERAWLPPAYAEITVCGAPTPNVNMWLIADANAFQQATGLPCRPKPADAKALTERGFGVTGVEKRETEIAAFVAGADLGRWTQEDNSFAGFLQECRALANRLGCPFGRQEE